MFCVILTQVVEVVMIGEDYYNADHPIHLHGYSFRVIAMDKLEQGITSKDIIEMDKQGMIVCHYCHVIWNLF